ncbi:rho guanine nucleotide exchange factor 17-like [Euwallacea fornicatus]|uniref:rho guanine nucleotide exchange factor 17-like n=1 Tax=Euwallacea fornicatus TaxID=995702 RepID=UPI00338F74D5
MSSPWQEGCLARCQDCTTSACSHFPGLSHEEPYKRFMTIGPVRYGMRVGAVSPPPPGAGPRYRSRTCCWPAVPHDTTTRIPLLPSVPSPINSLDIISCANRSEDAVTSEQTQTVRDHVAYPGGCLLNKRCALVYSRLVDAEPKDEFATLDRLPRFRFGGNRAEKRGSDKFRELTERLKRNAAATPVPPPRRHTRATPPPVEVVAPSPSPQKAAPLRSASFSQVDYCPDDNKYVRRHYNQESEITCHNTLPRPQKLPKSKQDDLGSSLVTNTSTVEETTPQLQVEKTLVRPQNLTSGSNLDRRRDRSRRRKGIYLPQWPTDLYPSDGTILPKYEEETVKDLQESPPADSKETTGSPQEPLSPEDCNSPLEWPSTTPTNNNNINCCINNNTPKVSISRSSSILRSDSQSEGEQEPAVNVTLDASDCESRLSINSDFLSPSIPRRYSKRPLRGPYGQMLEAEMKKPESRKNLNSDLKFLEDLSAQTVSKPKPRSRGSGNSSIDETYLKEAKIIHVAKRKVSADNLVVEQVAKQTLVPNHQRTTSSPSKLEGVAKPEVSKEFLEQLRKGGCDRVESKELGQPIQKDTRTHVLIELFDNERIYVESLEIIILNYWEPLKKTENSLIEQNLVEEIFYQIPFLLNHHRNFLLKLKARLEACESRATIGDLFLEMLTAPDVIENYVIYINSWKRSRDIIKNAQTTKPQFAKFLESASKSNARKLALDSLLIKPIQKFPKYELLLQRLIKHTPKDHPDYELLTQAQRVVHEQLLLINCTEKEALDIEQLRELESLIEGVVDLVAVERQLIRHDLVVISTGGGPKKERVLFLLSDLLLITGIKRRSGTITKKTSLTISTTSIDANKYKLVMKVPLEDVEIVKSKDEKGRRIQEELDHLQGDVAILNKITDLSLNLHCNHSNLDDLVKEMIGNSNKQIQLHQNNEAQLCVVDLSIVTQNGIESVSLDFPKAEIRASWEETLIECQAKLGDRRPTPEIYAILPIRKTRAGLVLSTAAHTFSDNGRDVWLCNSDGHVGQVCILNLNEKYEPAITSCNGICNSRILCITAVPGAGLQSRASSYTSIKSRDKLQSQKAIQLDSSSSSDEDDRKEDEEVKSDHKEAESSSIHSEEAERCTMWIGTEEGCILIYNSNDNIRIKKNKVKLQVGSSVLSLLYMENRVYASQANGYVLIFERDDKGSWNTSNPKSILVGNSSSPLSKLTAWNTKIVCACVNSIAILNPFTYEREIVITTHIDLTKDPENHHICCLVVHGNAVWMSMQNSAIIKCFNIVTYELIYETSVAPAVQRMLSCYDHIIRQHKAACLRVTSLLSCKDLLWIGTSAGVVLTMALPHVTPTTGKISRIPTISGVPHGNTGQVRILASLEMPYFMPLVPLKETPSKKNSKNKLLTDIPQSKPPKFLVVSGGEGYEDFRISNSTSEGAGREDSTNHVLLWTI